MTNPKFNVRLLRRVQKQILKHPKQFSMDDWKDNTECGTEMCIGGWAIFLHDGLPEESWVSEAPSVISNNGWPELAAEKVLGLTREESDVLFYSNTWPDKFRVPYERAEDSHSHPRMALWASKMIDWFIEHKKNGKEILP